MKTQHMQKGFIEKLNSTRKLLFSRFPQLESRDLCQFMGKLGHYHYNKKKFILLGEEREIYNFLIENCLNPFTFYRWLLLERVPEDIKFQVKMKRISQKKAVTEAFKRKHETKQSLGVCIREMGLSLVRGM